MAGAEGMMRAPGWRGRGRDAGAAVAGEQSAEIARGTTWRRDDWIALGLLVALCVALHVATCGVGVLFNETDGQYAGAAREMVESGDWVVPTNNEIPRLVKPPLLVWMVASSFAAGGADEFAARFPNALGLTVWCVGVFLIGRMFGGARLGFWAGAILSTVLGAATLGRILMPEPWFCAFVTLAIFAGLRVLDSNAKRAWALVFWGFAAMAAMIKGPHGLLYAGAIVGVFAIWSGDRSGVRALFSSVSGILLFLVVVLPWHFAIEARYPGFLQNLIVVEHFGHLVGSSAPATSYTDVPQGQFLAMHLAWFFPWSLIVLVQVCGGWLSKEDLARTNHSGAPHLANHLAASSSGLRHRITPDTPRSPGPAGDQSITQSVAPPCDLSGLGVGHHRLWRLALTWVVIGWVPMLFAGQRQDYYAMVGWPAFALAAAAIFIARPVRGGAIVLAVSLGLGLVFALALPLWGIGADVTAPVADRTTAVESLRQFSPSVWAGLRWLAVGVLGVGGVLAISAAVVRNTETGRIALLGVAGIMILGAIFGTARVAPYFSVGPVTASLQAGNLPDGVTLVYDGNIDTGSSLLVYSDLAVHLLDQNPESEFATREFGIGRDQFWASDQLVDEWTSLRPVVFVTESGDLERWSALLGVPQVRILDRCGTQVILANFH